MILAHFSSCSPAFQEKYDRIQWRNNETEFEMVRQTGYPIVDAGMRQLTKPVICTTAYA